MTAQTAPNPGASFPRVFGGIGFESLKNDVPRDNGFALQDLRRDSFAMRLEGGGAIAARLGAGAIFQDYELRREFCGLTGPGCVVAFDERLNRPSRALVVGVDAPLRIVNHLWVIPEIRFYHAPAPHLTNGQQWRQPDRRAIGITGRAGW